MASPSGKMATPQTTKDPLDILLARLLASTSEAKGGVDDSESGRRAGVPKTSKVGSMKADQEHDPWKALSDQVNDEISRQIFDDLDKQLDAQMTAELEKCQEEQSRRMDEELDRQIQEQLDAMLDASLGSELRDEQDGYEYYTDDDDGYSSDEEAYELENLPWSEGGEGGIGSLGLGELSLQDGDGASHGGVYGAPAYSQDELQKMVDELYFSKEEKAGGKQVGPGAWGKARWRPKGDT
ncbi:unnamed protein product [Scytosiphon promiscuus]